MHKVYHATALDVADSDELRFLPEGPYPIADGLFSWVAIQHGVDAKHGSLNRYDLKSQTNESFLLPGRPGFAFPCETANRFIVGCERTLGFYDTQTKDWSVLCDGVDEDVDNTIINDGIFYEDNLIFGTKDLEFKTKKAGLYLFRAKDKALVRLRSDQICSNGKAIIGAADGSLHLLDIDSPTRQIVRYQIDIDAAQLSAPEVVIDLASDPAVPDGAILTPDGAGLIVSMFLGEPADYGQTRLYDLASGELIGEWRTEGSTQNTCPAFIRDNGKIKLVITTASENISSEHWRRCPNSGRIFIAETDLEDSTDTWAARYPG